MAEVIFFIAAIGAIAGAVGTVALRNPFYSVLALVCHLLALAALFLLLRAEFVAAAQVVVYAGAVMVLYVFVVAYVGGSDEPLTASTRRHAAARVAAVRAARCSWSCRSRSSAPACRRSTATARPTRRASGRPPRSARCS